jgi:molybdenum cofactor biosynthesis enzyme MoaA
MADFCLEKGVNTVVEEVEATIRQTSCGDADISKEALTRKGITTLTIDQMMRLFGRIRLRFALSPQCNLWCFFCSNEGLGYDTKRNRPADIDLIIALSDMLLAHTPMRSIDFSGGEPTLHPDIAKGTYRLIEWARAHPEARFSFHTNGILLTPELIDEIAPHFARIGASVHSVNYTTWNRMTNSRGIPESVQQGNWVQLQRNLEYLAKQGIGKKIFMKSVVIRGFNDSEAELKAFLDACIGYGFHPKFLQFDPQYEHQVDLQVGRKELFEKLEHVGCRFPSDAPRHNDPNTYIPATLFTYVGAEGTKRGMHVILECGTPAACGTCCEFLCFFTKPTQDGKGLYLKPCSVHDTRFDLTEAIRARDVEQLVDIFKASREYLMTRPGLGVSSWGREIF